MSDTSITGLLTDEWEDIQTFMCRIGLPSYYPPTEYNRLTGMSGKSTHTLGRIISTLQKAKWDRMPTVAMRWIPCGFNGGWYEYRRLQCQ